MALTVAAGIDMPHMLDYLSLRRHDRDFPAGLRGHFMQRTATATAGLFIFRKRIPHGFYR
jgi:hypothetical protein